MDPVTRLNAALEGRYRIERQLGEGGMATVYLADDLKHERRVALKVLKPELAAVVGAERFLAEIKTTANLQHPHILPLHDSGEADSFLFYVMPYVEGDTLRDKIDREKQLSVQEALRITEKVASALDYAHKHGVVHRDIKPGNILLSSEGEPTVADFGIALAVAQAGGGRVTETGLSLGTPHYMSPEQATGDRDVDARTDVYALGCVLYEMLTGDPPYQGSTAQAVLGQILTGDPVWASKKRSSIPANADAAIRKALERLPADRFASAQEFAKALADPGFRHGDRAIAGVAGGVGSWNRLSVIGWGVAALAILVAGWSLLLPARFQPVSRHVLSTEGWAGMSVPFGLYGAIAPDGSSMILPVGSGQSGQLAVKMRGSTEITPIAGTEGGRTVVYSPDARWIAYTVGTDLFKRPLVGGSPVRLAGDADGGATPTLAWLDDGTILYEQGVIAGQQRSIVQIPEEGGELLEVFVLEESAGAPLWMQGLPGGRGALVATCGAQIAAGCSDNLELYVVDLRDLSFQLILEGVLRAWYAPTGHLVYVQNDGALFAAPFDLDALQITGGAIPLFDGVATTTTRVQMQLAADGTLLYVEGLSTSGQHQLVVVDLDGDEDPLVLAPRNIVRVAWSPDGQSVVYASEGQIYTYNVALGTTPRQLTFEGTNNLPVYSPDGSQVVFDSNREGTEGRDLFVKDLNDDSPPRSVIRLAGGQFGTCQRQWDTLRD